jgi:hypothetical protein
MRPEILDFEVKRFGAILLTCIVTLEYETPCLVDDPYSVNDHIVAYTERRWTASSSMNQITERIVYS